MWWLSKTTKQAMINELNYYNCCVDWLPRDNSITIDDYISYMNYAQDLRLFIYQAKTVKEFNQHMTTKLDTDNCTEIRQLLVRVQNAMLSCVRKEKITLFVAIVIICLLVIHL